MKRFLSLLFILPFSVSVQADLTGVSQKWVEDEFNDSSSGSRKRATVEIYTAASSAEDRACTLKEAAKAYADKGYEYVHVMLDASNDEGKHPFLKIKVGEVKYSPDGGGISGDDDGSSSMVFKVTGKEVSDNDKNVRKLWNEKRGDFQGKGYTDEEALSAFIRKKLKITEEEMSKATSASMLLYTDGQEIAEGDLTCTKPE